MFRLDGKVALVTGGARGIGAAIARAMVAEGAKVVIGDVLDREGEALAVEIGASAKYVHLDVTKPDDWETAVATAVKVYGKLNVLVNNAGIGNYAPIEQYSNADWDRSSRSISLASSTASRRRFRRSRTREADRSSTSPRWPASAGKLACPATSPRSGLCVV